MLLNLMEKVDKVDLLVTRKEESREKRGRNRKLRKECLNNFKKLLPKRNVGTWKELKEEVTTANCVRQMKEKLDR